MLEHYSQDKRTELVARRNKLNKFLKDPEFPDDPAERSYYVRVEVPNAWQSALIDETELKGSAS
eukprot:3666983-Alexandrium_andersonii.AAC.1